MPISNFPDGFSHGALIKEIPAGANNPRRVIWVGNNGTLLVGEKSASDGNKGTFLSPYSTLDYAVGQAKAGDWIFLRPGFVETVTAAGGLDLDVAGITIVFLGNGSNKAYITFTTDVSADMDIDAANITLINPKFVAGIDALTGPIDVNSTDFTIINGEYHDAAGIETTDCIIATSGATRMCIDGWKFFKSDEAGTQKESHIQCDGVDDLILRNIHVEGDFDTGIFETGTDECLRMTLENIFMKNTDPGNGPCIEMDSANSGWADNVHLRNANGTAVSDVGDINWSATCLQYSTDGYGGEPIGTADTSSIEAKLGDFTGPHDGAAYDDNVFSAIKVLSTFVADGDGDFATGTALASNKSLADAIGFDGSAFVAGGLSMYLPKCVEKADGAVLTGTDDLFTITGGLIRCKIVGHVTTIIGGATNLRLQHTTDDPSATVDLNAGAVACDNDAVGTVYHNLGATGVFTPSSGLGYVILDPVTVEETEYILAPGTIKCLGSAAQTGNIKWYISYIPLSPNSTVVAAA